MRSDFMLAEPGAVAARHRGRRLAARDPCVSPLQSL